MSDIQSISNGTYVIGDTSATTFIAGNGIKIDEPSAGTVRIGNDETVLWSGLLNAPSAITLSEKSNNFDRIKMYLTDQNGYREVKEYDATTATFALSMTTPYTSNRASTIIRYAFLSSTNYINYDYALPGRVLMTTGSNNYTSLDNAGPHITRIVGINRISGGNE